MLNFEITGASHAEYVGVKATGLPKGFKFNPMELADFMRERAPGNSKFTSKRLEADMIEFGSGIDHCEITDGSIELIILNEDVKKSDYNTDIIRPGTSDFTAKAKYGEDYNETGSGRFSGRMTAPMCALGGIVLQILEKQGIFIKTSIKSIGKSENSEEFEKIIEEAANAGDSVGGVVTCEIIGMPKGFGGPLFEGIEGKISENIFAIPGVKGIEFGSGFGGSASYGSENNDSLYCDGENIAFLSNKAGGILGGISNGMPITFNVAFKPTPSIGKKQQTVNYKTKENIEIEIGGRHDPCIVKRAVPVVRAMAAVSVYNILENDKKTENIQDAREKIDEIDDKITDLLIKRAELSKKIGELKIKENKQVLSKSREQEILNKALSKAKGDKILENIFRDFYEDTFKNSRLIQENQSKENYGLLGKTLTHSISPEIHKYLGNYNYNIYEETPEKLSDFIKAKNFAGLNVTIPYKQEIIKYIDELRGEAKDIETVNTIKSEEGRLIGYNTDCFGFETLLKTSGINVENKKCLILGNGGASKAVKYVLNKLNAAEIRILKRNEIPEYDAEIIINATPVGMYPENTGKLVNIADFEKAEAAIDLIYNPYKTDFLIDAKQKGIKSVNGLMMLVAQAVYSSYIWQNKELDFKQMVKDSYRVYAEIITKENIVLIGMPGSGKTTVGRALAEKLNKKFFDVDLEIEKTFGKSPAQIITEDGENTFRNIETNVLREIMTKENIVVSTGGGVVTREENYGIIAKNAVVCLLDTPLEMLATEGRPITKAKGNIVLYEERKDAYEKWADVRFRL